MSQKQTGYKKRKLNYKKRDEDVATSVVKHVPIELNQSLAEKNRFLARMDNNGCY